MRMYRNALTISINELVKYEPPVVWSGECGQLPFLLLNGDALLQVNSCLRHAIKKSLRVFRWMLGRITVVDIFNLVPKFLQGYVAEVNSAHVKDVIQAPFSTVK